MESACGFIHITDMLLRCRDRQTARQGKRCHVWASTYGCRIKAGPVEVHVSAILFGECINRPPGFHATTNTSKLILIIIISSRSSTSIHHVGACQACLSHLSVRALVVGLSRATLLLSPPWAMSHCNERRNVVITRESTLRTTDRLSEWSRTSAWLCRLGGGGVHVHVAGGPQWYDAARCVIHFAAGSTSTGQCSRRRTTGYTS
jgi:hypothetical protein